MSSTTDTDVLIIHELQRTSTIHKHEATDAVTEDHSNSLTNAEAPTKQSSDVILCVLWRSSKIGAAYYKINEAQVKLFALTGLKSVFCLVFTVVHCERNN